MEELAELIQSNIIYSTDISEGKPYIKLKQEVYERIKDHVIEDVIKYGPVFYYEVRKEIDKQTFQLLALGLLESINGYIFNPHKIKPGDTIPKQVKRKLIIHKQIYDRYPLE